MSFNASCVSDTLLGLYCSMISFARFSPGCFLFSLPFRSFLFSPFFYCSTLSHNCKSVQVIFLTYTLYFTISDNFLYGTYFESQWLFIREKTSSAVRLPKTESSVALYSSSVIRPLISIKSFS